jgi:CheY-like chemotaxis protein
MIAQTGHVCSGPSDQPAKIIVLLVDDQAFVGAAIGQLLESEPDIELHCCLFAANAIALSNQIVPTIVLQDLVMPDIDGLTLVRLFRTNPQTEATPVVVLSANDDAGARARALAAGAREYLVKLPSKPDLIACIRRHASRSGGVPGTLDASVIDRFRQAGAPDFTARLIDQFLLEAGARVLALREAAGRADVHALGDIAHSLKGSANVMGASRLAALCKQVEDHVAGWSGEPLGPGLVAEFDVELACVREAFTAERDHLRRG